MAIAEHEVAAQLSVRLNRGQQEKLEQAASAAGQSLDEFAASALLRAAEERDPLNRVIGIFQDEPLMEALMERVRADRRVEIEAETAD